MHAESGRRTCVSENICVTSAGANCRIVEHQHFARDKGARVNRELIHSYGNPLLVEAKHRKICPLALPASCAWTATDDEAK